MPVNKNKIMRVFLVCLTILSIISCRNVTSTGRIEVIEEDGVLTIVDSKSGYVFTVPSDNEASMGIQGYDFDFSVYAEKDNDGYKGLKLLIINPKSSSVSIDSLGRDGVWEKRN